MILWLSKSVVKCSKWTRFECSILKNGHRNDQNAKIGNWVSICIINELQGSLSVSWIGRTRRIIFAKFKLIQQVTESQYVNVRPAGRTAPYHNTTDVRRAYNKNDHHMHRCAHDMIICIWIWFSVYGGSILLPSRIWWVYSKICF